MQPLSLCFAYGMRHSGAYKPAESQQLAATGSPLIYTCSLRASRRRANVIKRAVECTKSGELISDQCTYGSQPTGRVLRACVSSISYSIDRSIVFVDLFSRSIVWSVSLPAASVGVIRSWGPITRARKRTLVHHRVETLRAEKIGALSDRVRGVASREYYIHLRSPQTSQINT